MNNGNITLRALLETMSINQRIRFNIEIRSGSIRSGSSCSLWHSTTLARYARDCYGFLLDYTVMNVSVDNDGTLNICFGRQFSLKSN